MPVPSGRSRYRPPPRVAKEGAKTATGGRQFLGVVSPSSLSLSLLPHFLIRTTTPTPGPLSPPFLQTTNLAKQTKHENHADHPQVRIQRPSSEGKRTRRARSAPKRDNRLSLSLGCFPSLARPSLTPNPPLSTPIDTRSTPTTARAAGAKVSIAFRSAREARIARGDKRAKYFWGGRELLPSFLSFLVGTNTRARAPRPRRPQSSRAARGMRA